MNKYLILTIFISLNALFASLTISASYKYLVHITTEKDLDVKTVINDYIDYLPFYEIYNNLENDIKSSLVVQKDTFVFSSRQDSLEFIQNLMSETRKYVINNYKQKLLPKIEANKYQINNFRCNWKPTKGDSCHHFMEGLMGINARLEIELQQLNENMINHTIIAKNKYIDYSNYFLNILLSIVITLLIVEIFNSRQRNQSS